MFRHTWELCLIDLSYACAVLGKLSFSPPAHCLVLVRKQRRRSMFWTLAIWADLAPWINTLLPCGVEVPSRASHAQR